MLTDKDFTKFKNIIYEESGLFFDSKNRVVLESRITSLMRERNINTVADFYELIVSDELSLRDFLDKVTTNLTKFFRIESHFKLLRNVVLPEIIRKKGSLRTIRIWSAGCSSGEEAYSLAMEALEYKKKVACNIKIFASDISLESLIIAKEGRYNAEKIANVPTEYISKYFDSLGNNEYMIKKEVKELITFDYHNLMNKGTQKNMDIIFCRNVLIYFDASSQKLTVSRFYDILEEGGYLFLGHSESLFGMDSGFKFNKIDDAIVYTKKIKKNDL